MLINTLVLLGALSSASAYWLMGIEDFITTQRIDPIVNPGKVSGHVHSVLGGSNFGFTTSTASLRESQCTSIPIPQDKSNYWFPHLYFQWNNGSFTSLSGGAVIYYLFNDPAGNTTAFPDDFRMITGDPTLRTYDPTSFAQQAVTFLCLDFNGVSTKWNSLPSTTCPSGIRAQINFPSCWDGKNVDSVDHKSHVAFLSTGPDTGTCSDPNFPVTLPRIFMEVYWASNDFDSVRSQAMNSTQPFVYSYGDPTGYGYHADYFNGWEAGVLQNAVDNCHCNIYGDPTCCVDQGIFDMNQGQNCYITNSVDEQTTGTIPKLPGNNPVQPFGTRATMAAALSTPAIIAPVYAYTGSSPTATGKIVTAAQTGTAAATSSATSTTGAASGSGNGGGGSNASASSSSNASSAASTKSSGSSNGGGGSNASGSSTSNASSATSTTGASSGSGNGGNDLNASASSSSKASSATSTTGASSGSGNGGNDLNASASSSSHASSATSTTGASSGSGNGGNGSNASASSSASSSSHTNPADGGHKTIPDHSCGAEAVKNLHHHPKGHGKKKRHALPLRRSHRSFHDYSY